MNAELVDAIARMAGTSESLLGIRHLIVALAIGGKLARPEDDETSTELAERLHAEREHQIKAGRIKRRKATPPIFAEELPIDSLTGCHFERLADLATLEKGKTGIQSAKPGPFPLVVTAEERSSCEHFDFDGAAAIIPMVSSAGHGKASIKRLHYQEGKFALGNILCAVFPLSENIISARFLYEYLTTFKEELLVSRMIGTANVSLTINKIGEVPVPLVSRAVQKRVDELMALVSRAVQKRVDELMALCDRLEAAKAERENRRDRLVAASLHRVNNGADADAFREHARFHLRNLPRLTTRPEHIHQLRQTILNLAVRGKLVPQDPNDEPARKLVERIKAQHCNDKARSRTVETNETEQQTKALSADLPQGWELASLGDLVIFGPQNGISPKPSTRPDAPRAITLTATTKGVFDPNYFKRVEASIPITSEFWLRPGDLLFQRGNTREYVGMAAYYTGAPCTFLYPDLMMKVRISEGISLRYIHLSAIAPSARAYFSREASGAQASMPKINQGILLRLPVPLPPLPEQHRIVAKVEELMSLCDQVEAQLTTSQTESRRLLEAVLHDALGGAAH